MWAWGGPVEMCRVLLENPGLPGSQHYRTRENPSTTGEQLRVVDRREGHDW